MSDRNMTPVEVSVMAQSLLRQLSGGNEQTPEEYEAAVVSRYNGDLERRERDEQRMREDRAERRRDAIASTLNRLPPKLRATVTSVEIVPTDAYRAVAFWVKSPVSPRVLMLRGGVGVGKSVAAALAIRDFAEMGKHDCAWMRPGEFASAVLHSYDPKSPRLPSDLLVIDEAGTEKKDDFSEALCAFIDDHNARVIITTNLRREQFRERYQDPRLLDRLRESGLAVDLKGETRRKQEGDF